MIDLNLGNSSVEIAEHELQAAIQHVGWDRIYSIECKRTARLMFMSEKYLEGNEPDQYAGSIRPANWTSEDYVTQFLVSTLCYVILVD